MMFAARLINEEIPVTSQNNCLLSQRTNKENILLQSGHLAMMASTEKDSVGLGDIDDDDEDALEGALARGEGVLSFCGDRGVDEREGLSEKAAGIGGLTGGGGAVADCSPSGGRKAVALGRTGVG
jgi:hypothetical protein